MVAAPKHDLKISIICAVIILYLNIYICNIFYVYRNSRTSFASLCFHDSKKFYQNCPLIFVVGKAESFPTSQCDAQTAPSL